MKNIHSLKLSASSIGSAAPYTKRSSEPAEDTQPAPTQQLHVVEAQAAPEPAPAPRVTRVAPSGLRKRLLLMGVVELAGTLAAIAATGSVHNTIFRIAAAGLALTVAAVVAIETLAPRRRIRSAAAARPVATRAPRKSLTKSKIALLLVMAAGFATYFGNGGSFSSFSADTTNANSSIASGTLLLSNQVTNSSGTTAAACLSTSGSNNFNATCDKYFTLTGTGNSSNAGNLGPALYGAVAQIQVKNTGSLDASKLEIYAPSSTDCVSSQVAGLGSPNWNTGNLCSSAIMYVQEIGTNHHYCWYGVSTSTSACAAPFTETFNGSNAGAATVNGTTTQINFTGTPNGNIVAGDKIHVTQLVGQYYNVEECTATGSSPTVDVWMGDNTATSIPVSGCTLVSGNSSTSFTAATVTDYTTTASTGPLAGTFASDTISNFDTSYATIAHPLPIYPTTGDGTINNTAYGIGLPAGTTRTFYVGVYLPAPTSGNQNTLQDLQANFSLTWHIEQ